MNRTLSMAQKKGVARMPMRWLLVFLLTVTCSAEKKREWQTGTLLDSSSQSVYAGTVGNANATVDAWGNTVTTNSSARPVYRVYDTYVMDSEKYRYLISHRLKWRWSKSADVTVNAPVEFAVEKRKMFIRDESGKEHKAEILKRVLK